ncbi:hypothetical protein [Streptomyces sp. NPDC059631]|uniref:hypothetical protein n=1 Tax=unclassified Streptomyces TaxID=2593676 RepID=UPI003696E572
MTDTEVPDFDVVVTFSAAEHAVIVEHAAELDVPVAAYIHQAATRRSQDGQAKRDLIRQAGDGAVPGTPTVADLLDDLREPDVLTDQEREARAREAARELGIEYTEEVRALGQALWDKIRSHHSAGEGR